MEKYSKARFQNFKYKMSLDYVVTPESRDVFRRITAVWYRHTQLG